jgi:glycosyltransferase involved in cell wall biosynthesis
MGGGRVRRLRIGRWRERAPDRVSRTVRISIDGATWDNRRGYGRFTREILKAAAERPHRHELTLVLDSTVPAANVPAGICVKRVDLRQSPGMAASATGRRSVPDAWRMTRALTADRPDAVFFPSVYTYVPVTTRTRVIVCVHDVIPERFPQYVFPTRRGRLLWSAKVRLATWQATRIVTVSEHARRGIAEYFGVHPREIRVVPEAPSASFTPVADTVEARAVLHGAGLPAAASFFLYVGGIAPHKNLPALVSAVAAVRTRPGCGDATLIIVGDYTRDVFHSSYEDVRRQSQAEIPGACLFTGGIDDTAVAGLMRLCRALVLPSFDEGFGLPGIEAARCGAAVIATRSSALPEVLGDAALFFDPADVEALADLLHRVLTDDLLRTSLGTRAATRAASCTWDTAAGRLLSVFDELEALG